MAWLLFFTRCDVFCDLLQYTHTEKCCLFVLYNKNQMVSWRIFGAWKKKNKSADVIWRGFDAICVCPLIDHGQQPMKMPTEVTLLYIYIYIYIYICLLFSRCVVICDYSTHIWKNVIYSLNIYILPYLFLKIIYYLINS